MSEQVDKAPKEEEVKTSQKAEHDELEDEEIKQDPTAENEIRVAAKGQIKNYLGYAFRILNKTNHKSLKIRATGNAIVKANILIELVKRRVGDLHQLNSIYSMVIKSTEDKNPLGEKAEMRRRVTAMDTLLSKEPLDENDPGYQKPEPKDEPYHGSRQPRAKKGGDNPPEQKAERKKKGPKLYNAPVADKDDDKKDGGKPKKDKDAKKRDETKKEDKAQNNDEKKSGRRSRKDKLESKGVKDDEMDKGKKKDKRGRDRGRHMMPPDMYGPRMGMMPGPDGPRGYPMPPMDRYGDYKRPRDPRAMPPYMGYPPVRSFDDFNVRTRSGKGRRGPPPMGGHRGMIMYPPYYDPYMQYPDYGPERRYNQGSGRNEPMRYNNEPPRGYNAPSGQGGPPMYNEPPRGQRMPVKGGPGGPAFEPRRGGPPPEHREGWSEQGRDGPRKDERPPKEREDERRFNDNPRMDRGMRGGGEMRPPKREFRQFNPEGGPGPRGPDGPNIDRSRFGENITRGARGMRGSRGGGFGRGGRDRPEDGEQGFTRSEFRGGRRGDGSFVPTNMDRRGEREEGEVKQNHNVHQRPSRGGRGGAVETAGNRD